MSYSQTTQFIFQNKQPYKRKIVRYINLLQIIIHFNLMNQAENDNDNEQNSTFLQSIDEINKSQAKQEDLIDQHQIHQLCNSIMKINKTQQIILQDLSQLSIIYGDKKQDYKQIINFIYNNNHNQQYDRIQGAFVDDYVQIEEDLQAKVNSQSVEQIQKDIRITVAILNIQFPHLNADKMIDQLYQKMVNHDLPVPYDPSYQLSQTSLQNHDCLDKIRFKYQDQYEISLISIQDQNQNIKEIDNKKDKSFKQELYSKQKRQYEKDVLQYNHNGARVLRSNTKQFLEREAKQREIQKQLFRDEQLRDIMASFEKRQDSVKLFAVKITSFNSEEQKSKFIQKRMAAKAFIRKGYGLSYLRKELIETPYNYRDQARYKSISYGMVTDTFRKIQHFINENCILFAHRMQKIEMKPLYSILLNCRDLFPQESSTFIKFMQIMFNVDCEYMFINKKDAITLYERIINIHKLKEGGDLGKLFEMKIKRQKTIRAIDMHEQDDGWTVDNDMQLMGYYRQQRILTKVRDRYRERYGHDTMFEDCKILKSKLNKALRASIRKLKSIASENKQYNEYIYFLNNLNNDRIKKILISPDAIESRVMLCDFYISKSITNSLMQKTVKIVQNTIANIERKRGEFTYENDDFRF